MVDRPKKARTSRLQVTVDQTTDRILGEMIGLGIHGGRKSEVASWVLKTWIWENQEKLMARGIHLAKASPDSQRQTG